MTDTSPQPRRKRPTGRRTGDSGTRDAILDSARDLFAEHGYEGASLRAIAARAGVDSGLIRHFFGDKESLFATTMADRTVIPERLAAAVAGPIETLGARATDAYLRLWDDEETKPILLALVRSAMTSQHGAELLVDVIGGRVREASPLPSLDDPRAPRFALAVSHLFGVAVARNVLKMPVLAEMPHDELVAQLAPTIQNYLTGTPD
ncbi:TetR family transcriptional regulator [Brachybacterium kimchii]|uniref:TetR family transcriptional regulator n=1 Tax=Brachybacterium kimchii TaxID=2942909 RepID=A0ABY4N3P2_9MICO|nr:TetR family transcriptional regulator [Brachybacterium kimchii]UQN28726.1 TetR family transcriptional regulator [Brachybacterium kimchii]